MNVFERMAQALEAANVTVDRTNHLSVVAQGCDLIERFNALGIEMVTEEPVVLGPSLTELEVLAVPACEPEKPVAPEPNPTALEKALDKIAPKRLKRTPKAK